MSWAPAPTDLRAPLRGRETAKVVVIGGGFAGLAAALRLARRGVDVALVEREFCGFGASSRNAGHLTPTICGDPQFLLLRYPRRAKRLLELAEAAVAFTEGLIADERIECSYEQTGNVFAAFSSGQLPRSRKLAERLQDLGASVSYVGRDDGVLPAGRFVGGVLERSGGHMNPGEFVYGLRERAVAAGVRVFERSPVVRLHSSPGGVTVGSRLGEICAERALVATNAYAGPMRLPRPRAVAPLWVTLAETEPLDDRADAALAWDSRVGIYSQHLIVESYRPTARGGVVFGTRTVRPPRGRRLVDSVDPNVVAELTRALAERMPALAGAGIARAWGGWVGMTASLLPVAGALDPRTSYLLGFNGHGLAQAPYLGTLFGEWLAGGELHPHLDEVLRPEAPRGPVLPATRFVTTSGWLLDRARDRLARPG